MNYPEMKPAPPAWLRAMQRATAHHVKTFRMVDGSFTVPSSSKPSLYYRVVVENGKITGCDCEATVVCKHKGAVAKRLLIERFGEYAVRQMLAGPVQKAS